MRRKEEGREEGSSNILRFLSFVAGIGRLLVSTPPKTHRKRNVVSLISAVFEKTVGRRVGIWGCYRHTKGQHGKRQQLSLEPVPDRQLISWQGHCVPVILLCPYPRACIHWTKHQLLSVATTEPASTCSRQQQPCRTPTQALPGSQWGAQELMQRLQQASKGDLHSPWQPQGRAAPVRCP